MASFSSILSRRLLLQRAALAGVALPAAGVLLAACGADDEDPTATAGTGDATATSGGTTDATATSGGEGEATPTEGMGEETPTVDSGSGDVDYFGFEIEPPQNEDGVSVMQLGYESNGLNPLNFDGWAGGSVWGPMAIIFEQLIERNPVDGQFVPNLATAWEVADDGITWTFSLRDDVLWHDGEQFTADDVVFTYTAVQNPDYGSLDVSYVTELLASIEAPDDHTVVMTSTDVNSEFLGLAVFFIGAEHVLSPIDPTKMFESGATTGSDPSMVVGTGPFKLKERVFEDRTTVERFDDYWVSRPSLSEINFAYAVDPTVAEPRLMTGEFQWGWATFEAAEGFRTNPLTTLHTFPSLDLIQISLNHDPEKSEVANIFEDLRVRQAMVYAMDREAIIEAFYFGLSTLAETPLIPGQWSNDPTGVTARYPFDPEMAMQLLDEAGWVPGADGIREKDGQRFSFLMLGWEVNEPLRLIIQQMYRDVGIEMETQTIKDEVLFEQVEKDHDYQAIPQHAWMGGSGWDGFYWTLASTNYPGGGNWGRIDIPEIDDLLEQIKLELDQDVRIELFTQLQNVYMDQLPVLPIVHDGDVRITAKTLHNCYPNAYRTTFNAETWWVDA
jgi:peptide/nickel transport system substrate-binding protein